VPRRLPLLLLALVAACSAGSTVAPAPSLPPSLSPAASPSPSLPVSPPVPPRTLAVLRPAGPVELYALTGQRATRSARLQTPKANARALAVSGTRALICVVWLLSETEYPDPPDRRLVCYPTGGKATVLEAAGRDPSNVAVRPDGRRIAWSDLHDEGNERISVATWTDGHLGDVQSYLADPGKPPGQAEKSFTGAAADDLAWNGDEELVVTVGYQSDDGSGPVRFRLGSTRRGWLQAPEVPIPSAESKAGYYTYDRIVSVDDGTALAVERPQGFGDGPQPPERAVRIALSTGQILDVLATAATGRYVTAVSGDRSVVVYATAAHADEDQLSKVYVRYAADPRGIPVTGLPPDVTGAVLLPTA
jgi:hypothetical protein